MPGLATIPGASTLRTTSIRRLSSRLYAFTFDKRQRHDTVVAGDKPHANERFHSPPTSCSAVTSRAQLSSSQILFLSDATAFSGTALSPTTSGHLRQRALYRTVPATAGPIQTAGSNLPWQRQRNGRLHDAFVATLNAVRFGISTPAASACPGCHQATITSSAFKRPRMPVRMSATNYGVSASRTARARTALGCGTRTPHA